MSFYFKQFLESSTIHGLVYISTESKFARLFWMLVVSTGFIIATLLINDAYTNWSESPIKTTIEKRSISEITFPKVTVCPPKNTFTDLNYDLMMLENMTLTNETRQELLDIAMNNLLLDDERDQLYNLTKLEEENRWYNWYHGYTEVWLPNWNKDWDFLQYRDYTLATNGRVKSQYFGDNYDPNKIERALFYPVYILPPGRVVGNRAYTLTLEIERVLMNVSGNSHDHDPHCVTIMCDRLKINNQEIANDLKSIVLNLTGPGTRYELIFERRVTQEDIDNNADLGTMPGFELKWYYTPDVAPEPRYYNGNNAGDKVRLYSYGFLNYLLHGGNLKSIVTNLNRLLIINWEHELIEKMLKALVDKINPLYEEIQKLTGKKDCQENCQMSSIEDLELLLKVTNHPVHIVDENGKLSPSALVPFCWFGKDMNPGIKIDQFKMPVCTGFEKILRNDQICYEYDPKSIVQKDDVRLGLHLIVDDNQDKMMKLGTGKTLGLTNDLKFKYNRNDVKEGTKIFLDAIGKTKIIYKQK